MLKTKKKACLLENTSTVGLVVKSRLFPSPPKTPGFWIDETVPQVDLLLQFLRRDESFSFSSQLSRHIQEV